MDEASSVNPLVGMVLQERYRILDKLADGSMGAVYRAERLQLGRRVAIKFLHASYARDPNFIQRFERETVVMSRLTHPHCVSVIDFGVEGAPYVVMEYVSGRTLRSIIEDGRLSVERSAHICKQVLAGLAHAHSQGIVHRDIKPANIMLSEATGTGEHVRILDFGLATLRDAHSSELSQSMIVVGTPNYMSPEQSLATKVDGRSDIYSTGIVLFEMLTGQKPYNADDTYELLLQHRNAPIPKLAAVTTGAVFPPGLQSVVERALAKDPADRFASAIEFSAALDAATAPTSVHTPVPGSLPPVPPAIVGRAQSELGLAYRPTEAISSQDEPRGGLGLLSRLLVLALLCGAAYAGYRTWRGRSEEQQPVRAGADQPAGLPAQGVPSSAAADAAPNPAAPGVVVTDAAPSLATATDAGSSGWPVIPEEEPPPEEEGPIPEEEKEEPVAPVADDAEEVDQAEPTTEPEVATEPEPESEPSEAPLPRAAARPDPIDTVPEAVAAIRAGRRAEAIRALRLLRRKMPRSAYVPYLLGNLYMEKRWWTVGMDHYRAAIRNHRGYRWKRILNQNMIRALASPKTRRKAAGMIVYTLGRAAYPYLKRAAKSDRNSNVRRQASYLARRVRRRR